MHPGAIPNMLKSYEFYSPYLSIFESFPRLLHNLSFMAPPAAAKRLSSAQYASIIAIGKSVRATNYPNREEQRSFLDEKTNEYVRPPLFPSMLHFPDCFSDRFLAVPYADCI